MVELYGADNAQVAAQWNLTLAEHGYPLADQPDPPIIRK
jgi:hypothetical protein